MNKFLFTLAIGTFALMSCSKDISDDGCDLKHSGKNHVTIIDMDGGTVTRSDTDFKGGTATGAGDYNGDAKTTITAQAKQGYQLVRFEKAVDNNADKSKLHMESLPINEGRKQAEHQFKIDSKDWLFKVKFAKEYTIESSGENGTVTGGGTYAEGDKCTLTAKANDGYQFDGWYENGNKISSENPYSFVVSSNRT